MRVGDTVRRPPNANSDFVRRPLGHLAARGFDGVPRSFGTDKVGREVFSYIEGEVPAELGFHDDRALCAAAVLIRRFHDLGAELMTSSAAHEVGIEVICHNDLSPCNFVFKDGLPVAMIDFDAASPGTRAYDFGYAAWLWLDFGSPEVPPAEQRRRLRLFADAYGGMDRHVVLRSMMERQMVLVAEGTRQGNSAMSAWAADCLQWTRHHAPELTIISPAEPRG
jgi:aminoglycoside phosphotransferase (APT) family kinase protein